LINFVLYFFLVAKKILFLDIVHQHKSEGVTIMKDKRYFAWQIPVFIFFLLNSVTIIGEPLIYNEISTDGELTISLELSPFNKGFVFLSEELERKAKINKEIIRKIKGELDATYALITWELFSEDEKMEIKIERTANIIYLSGIHKGKKVSKKYKIDDSSWYQDWGLGLRSFILSDSKKIDFWSINLDDLNEAKFSAVKEKDETITLGNIKESTIYVTITLQGLPAFIFTAQYWFEKREGLEVLRKINKGPFSPLWTKTLKK